MGEEDALVVAPSHAVTVERNPGSQIALALTVFALVLAANSIINESWLTDSITEGDLSAESDLSLSEINSEICTGEECTSSTENFGELYDDCMSEMKGATSSEKEEVCGSIGDYHDAGYVATIMLVFGSLILLIATIMQVRSMIGHNSRLPNAISGFSGVWIGLSVLVWSLMLPETEADPEWGQGLWMALIASVSAFIAGFSGTLQSWVDGPPRLRAKGIRSGTGMNEFVLKESSCGNNTLSILVDSELIRVARVERVGASPAVTDILASRRDSYTGFSHQRLDWLDDFKGVWWVVSGASLISSFMISTLFLIPFFITIALAILQLMDPERFVVSTNSGNHPFYINRWRSNRELTDLAMELVDEVMIAVLRGEDLDTTKIDSRAELIAERFTKNREAKQAAEAAAEAEKEAAMAAKAEEKEVVETPQEIPPPPAQDESNPSEAEITAATEEQPPTASPPQPAEATDDAKPVPETTPDEVEQITTPAVSQQEELPEKPPVGENNVPEDAMQESTEQKPNEVETSPEAPAANPPVPEPVTPPAGPVVIPPPPALPPTSAPPGMVSGTPPPPSAFAPPAASLPPPPSPLPSPPGMAGMPSPPPPGMAGLPTPPPPGMAGMPSPPPPGMAGMPSPPPPMGAPIIPPMGVPLVTTPPPPVVVQAAPREDNLTDDEKDDLLGDLSS